MTSVLKIGNLKLDMGNMSHILGVPNNEVDFQKFLKYQVYQSKFVN